MKHTTLEIVNKCLESINEDVVTALTGRTAQKVLNIVEDVFYDLLSRKSFPRSRVLSTLTALETTADPTTFNFESSSTDFVRKLIKLEYNVATSTPTTTPSFREIEYIDPELFLERSNQLGEDFDIVAVNTDTLMKVRNNAMPKYWTTFDQKAIYLDSYDSSIESYLVTSKTRALFEKIPLFLSGADDVQNIDTQFFNILIREAQSMCHAILKDGVNQKIEQAARTDRVMYQNDRRKNETNVSRRPNYGRR